MQKPKTIFIGTSDFAVPILDKILKSEYLDLKAVVTQPDKKAGRKQQVNPSPIKKYFEQNLLGRQNIELFQPEKISSQAEEILGAIQPELIIVASYGQFIPESILKFPKYKCLNIHASLLPTLRGAVPMPIAILKGFEKTGISIQIMEKKMDIGDLIASAEFEISPDETTQSLTHKASQKAAILLDEVVSRWIGGEIIPTKQDEKKATYCFMGDIAKEKAEIDFSKSAKEIDRLIRAFYPWPIAWFEVSEKNKLSNSFLGKRIKVYKATICDMPDIEYSNAYSPAQIFKYKKQLHARCGDKLIRLDEIQLEGKKRLEGSEYLFLTA
jgi:methionyl-tRNA formyltransferase